MTDVTTPYAWAAQLVDVAQQATANTFGGEIQRAFVSPTKPALDCCPQLTVDVRALNVVVGTTPNTPTPNAQRKTVIHIVYEATFYITVVRCSSEADLDDDELPAVAGMEKVARETNEDLWAIWNAVAVAYRAGQIFDGKCLGFEPLPVNPVSQSGGCVGWELAYKAWIPGYDAIPGGFVPAS